MYIVIYIYSDTVGGMHHDHAHSCIPTISGICIFTTAPLHIMYGGVVLFELLCNTYDVMCMMSCQDIVLFEYNYASS